MSSEIAIKVENLSKCYHIYEKPRDRLLQMLMRGRKQLFREFWALRDVSFEIKKGQTFGIIGRNGSGKSTLLQMICGTLNPSAGQVETHGRVAALLELGSGFNPEFTGRENVYLNGALLGLSKSEIDERFDAIAEFADIGQFIDQPVKTYSSGMYVRLAFAIQASVDPEILIVDEALAVGDAYFVHRCMMRFHELQAKGTTILFVSHDALSVKRLCNQALWIDAGKVIKIGDASEVVDSYVNCLFSLEQNSRSVLFHEQGIGNSNNQDGFKAPIGDARLGESRILITGILMSGSKNAESGYFGWGDLVVIRYRIENISLAPNLPISVGYILRDSKGIDICSTNSVVEGHELHAPERGSALEVSFNIKLPMIHPGSYSFTPSVSSICDNSAFVIEDRVINALIFDVESAEEIYTVMRFPTEISYRYTNG